MVMLFLNLVLANELPSLLCNQAQPRKVLGNSKFLIDITAKAYICALGFATSMPRKGQDMLKRIRAGRGSK
jgi:hypothetical protein